MMKLGVIGLSEGNGHPYSWAAIFNGFDLDAMNGCEFPVIPQYLSVPKYPDDFLTGRATVSHIWTQEESLSRHVAEASKIPHVCTALEDMIGAVDGVLMARDDWQNHMQFALPFLKAGLPIYIDKPLANSVEGAKKLFDLQQFATQIYSGSALRYAKEFEPFVQQAPQIRKIRARTIKSWSMYGIHVIEPVVRILYPVCGAAPFEVLEKTGDGEKSVFLKVRWGDVEIELISSGNTSGGIGLEVELENGDVIDARFEDTFFAFRAALEKFVEQVESGAMLIPRAETLKCMELIEHGT